MRWWRLGLVVLVAAIGTYIVVVPEAPPTCASVHAQMSRALGVTADLGAVQVRDVGSDGAVDGLWIVATGDGAAWLTSPNPGVEGSRTIYPLNDQAIAASEFPAVGPGAPALRGFGPDSVEIAAASACATG